MTGSRLDTHLEELRSQVAFAWRVCPKTADAVRLVWRTMLFHFANRTGMRLCNDHPFRVRLALRNLSTDVWLRTFSGDLFVFFEVLKNGVYYLPEDIESTEGVRTIVDLGANVGIAAIYLADRYPLARVYAVEPAPANFALLKRNLSTIERTESLEACVSDGDGTRRLNLSAPAWGVAVAENGNGAEVVSFSIATLLSKLRIQKVDILKVDIEGEERIVFGSAECLERIEKILIELHGEYGPERFRADVERHGFQVFPIGSLPTVQIVLATSTADAGVRRFQQR